MLNPFKLMTRKKERKINDAKFNSDVLYNFDGPKGNYAE